MSRPRKVSDEEVFAAAYRVMMRLSPAEVTLAEIAAEAGVTAGALVQRFGSKRDLLLAVAARSADAASGWFEQLRAGRSSPLAVLYAYADCLAAMGDTPSGFAHHLSWLQLDLSDPDFRRHLQRQAAATRRGVTALLREAVEAGELGGVDDIALLARAVEVTLSGSLLTWAFADEGTAVEWIRHDLDVLLMPYATAGRSQS